MNNAKIYLCQADRSILGTLTGTKTDTCSLTKNATDLWEITFDVDRYVDVDGQLVQSDYYDSIGDMMKLYLDSENTQAFFVIDSEPIIKGESFQETKTVTAHSIECELNHMYLKNFKVNCGTVDSQEYLVTDENDNPTNIDVYTNLPKEYISLVNYDNHQLSLLHLVLEGTGWTVKDDIDKEVCEIKKSFETSDSVYAFLMKTVSPTASVMFEFDRKHKQIGIVKIEDYGEDTGVFVTMRNLMNSFEVTSSSDDSIMTRLVPTGANGLGIEYVNFGQSHIINLDHFMNTLNEYDDYKYVSAELHDKYNRWKNYRDVEKVTYNDDEYTRRELYRELTKLYNKTILDISEVYNRLPNDGCVIDYKTFSLEDLKVSLKAYNNALVALITIYKNEYGVTEIGNYPDCTPTPSTATNIKDTPYWYDYYAYQEKIIPQVTEALKMYCETDENGNLVSDENGEFIELEFGNPDYYVDGTIVKNIDGYLYEWSLYGLNELESKKKAWSEAANVLYDECFIATGTAALPTYRTPDDDGWNSLSNEQKQQFTSKDAFVNKLNQYLDYMSFDDRENSLTNTVGKGIIRQCEDAIAERNNEIAVIQERQETYDLRRQEIAAAVAMENFFTDDDLVIINSMLREKEYSNENILITNLDDVVSTVDVQEELYQESIKELDKLAQPQYSFKTELDNIYALEEFKSYRKPFNVGNFIRVGLEIHEDLYDNNYIKLRLISIVCNPLEMTEDLSVEFSTMTKSLNTISDLAFLLDNQNQSSGGGTSSSSSGGGAYGDNDADVQISNNMLNALLKTEMFGSTITDVILDSMKANKGNFNTLFAHSGVFDSLEAGRIKISGDCLFDKIKSNNWNGLESDLLSNTKGSAIDLSNGSFNFGGGKIKYDSTRNVMTMQDVEINWNSANPPKTSDIDGLEEYLNQLDGRIQTYSQSTDPSTNWSTTEKKNHIGDIWFDTKNNLTKTWNGSSWNTVTDSELEKLAKSKAQIFTSTPTVPYYKGDLWVQGSSGDIKNCTTSRTSGSYTASDWVKSSKYTDDSALQNFITGDYATALQNINTQIDGKARAWYQSTDPSLTWDKTEDHEGDLWYNTNASSQVTSIYKDGAWKATSVPKSLFDTIDGIASIYVTVPSKPQTGDLLIPTSNIGTTYKAGKVYKYNGTTWVEISYTDDTKANEAYTLANSAKGVADNAKTIGDNLVTGLGFKETEVTGKYVISPVIAGGTLLIGDKTKTYAQITTDGKLSCTGASISGSITATSLTLGDSVKVAASKVSGLSTVATSGKYTDLTNKPSIPSSLSDLTDGANVMHFSDITFGTPTTSNGVTTQTITYKDSAGKSYNYTNKYSADGSYLLTNVGKGTGSWSTSTDAANHTNNYFCVTTDGLLRANNAVIYGDIYATNGRFSGDVIANTLTANQSGSIAGWNFNSTSFYKNDIRIGAANGFYIGEDGISIGENFIASPSGFVSQSTDYEEVSVLSKYFKNTEYSYPYWATNWYTGDFIASYVIYFENNYSGKVYVKFKNANYDWVPVNGGYPPYDSSIIYEYNATNGKLVLTVCDWSVYTESMDYILSIYPIETTPSIQYGDVHEVWANAGITNIKVFTGGNATGTATNFTYHCENVPTRMSSQGIKIDTANSNISTKKYCLDKNGVTFFEPGNVDDLTVDNRNELKDKIVTLNANGLSVSLADYDELNNLSFSNYIVKLDTASTNAGIVFYKGSSEASFGVNGIKHTQAYEQLSFSGLSKRTLYVGSDGTISAASSSRRYKQDISTELDDIFDPHTIYDLPVSQFRYKEDFGGGDDSDLYIGFIAEDVAKYYPSAARWNADHTEVDTWEMSDMFPALVKLIQEQHNDIELLKAEIERLKQS